jgi:FAD/FMN-containing dehydrogenase
MQGHHARRDELPRAADNPLHVASDGRWQVPFDLPSFALNPVTVGAFNAIYHASSGRRAEASLRTYEDFFYPLDKVRHWNRVYGSRGFLQYQFLVPEEHAEAGVRRTLERLAASRRSSFLAVLKRFGPGDPGPLSFPQPGYTLACDLPMTGSDVLTLLDEIDDIVIELGGRVYLAKDARLAPDKFRAMYPRLEEWSNVKAAVDPTGRFSSELSRRLRLDGRVTAHVNVA